jgi:hypothetical protein
MKFSVKHTALALALVGAVSGAQATLLLNNVPTSSVDMVADSIGGTLLDSAPTLINPNFPLARRWRVMDDG